MRVLVIVLVLAVGALPATGRAQEHPDRVPSPESRAPSDAIAAAARALNADAVTTLVVTGHGADFVFGQAYDGNSPWPRFDVPRYTLTVDYAVPALRDERIRVQGQNPPLGGSNQPMVGQQRQVWVFSGNYAWNVGGNGTATPAGRERDLRTALAWRQALVWLTPHGFVKAAQAARDTVARYTGQGEHARTVLSFTTPTGVKLEGVIGADGRVQHVETWVGTPVLGDVVYEADFSDYREFNGVVYPRRVVHRYAGYPLLDIVVDDVKANAAEKIEVPASVRDARPPAPFVSVPVQLADGVWSIPLGPRDRSVLIELADYLVVAEAPESEEISEIALAAIRKVAGDKPIRYVINTHTHFDHSGGLRTYAAEGATVITHASNVDYYRQAWSAPRTLRPDRLSTSGRTPVFEGVAGSRTLTDGDKRVVIYHYAGNLHHPGMLMVHLPRERLLIEADSYNPQNDPKQPPNAMPNLIQFYNAVQRLRLDVDQLVPLHGRLTTLEDAKHAIDTFGDLR